MIFLIYEGVSILMTKGRTEKSLHGHAQAIRATTHSGSSVDPLDVAQEAAGALLAQDDTDIDILPHLRASRLRRGIPITG